MALTLNDGAHSSHEVGKAMSSNVSVSPGREDSKTVAASPVGNISQTVNQQSQSVPHSTETKVNSSIRRPIPHGSVAMTASGSNSTIIANNTASHGGSIEIKIAPGQEKKLEAAGIPATACCVSGVGIDKSGTNESSPAAKKASGAWKLPVKKFRPNKAQAKLAKVVEQISEEKQAIEGARDSAKDRIAELRAELSDEREAFKKTVDVLTTAMKRTNGVHDVPLEIPSFTVSADQELSNENEYRLKVQQWMIWAILIGMMATLVLLSQGPFKVFLLAFEWAYLVWAGVITAELWLIGLYWLSVWRDWRADVNRIKPSRVMYHVGDVIACDVGVDKREVGSLSFDLRRRNPQYRRVTMTTVECVPIRKDGTGFDCGCSSTETFDCETEVIVVGGKAYEKHTHRTDLVISAVAVHELKAKYGCEALENDAIFDTFYNFIGCMKSVNFDYGMCEDWKSASVTYCIHLLTHLREKQGKLRRQQPNTDFHYGPLVR